MPARRCLPFHPCACVRSALSSPPCHSERSYAVSTCMCMPPLMWSVLCSNEHVEDSPSPHRDGNVEGDGENWRCPDCTKNVVGASKSLYMSIVPPVLIMHLKRFCFSKATCFVWLGGGMLACGVLIQRVLACLHGRACSCPSLAAFCTRLPTQCKRFDIHASVTT